MQLTRNIAANVVGRVWSVLSNALFVPAYVTVLGVERYGVVALYASASAVLAMFDLGFSPTLARELNSRAPGAAGKRSLLAGYERLLLLIVALLVSASWVLPKPVIGSLLSRNASDGARLEALFPLLVGASAAQLLLHLYVAALLGIERQVEANGLLVLSGLVRTGLVLVPLALVPEPEVFLWWQLGGTLAFSWLVRERLYASLPTPSPGSKPPSAFAEIVRNVGFSGSMLLIAAGAAVNTQADKWIISRELGLARLSEYYLVSTFGSLLLFAAAPVMMALTPRFVRVATSSGPEEIRGEFVAVSRLLGAALASVAVSMVTFGPALVEIWTAGRVRREGVEGYLGLVVAGFALLAWQTVPHGVAVALKRVGLARGIAASVVVTVPAYWVAVRSWGAVGAAGVWFGLQLIATPLYFAWVVGRVLGAIKGMSTVMAAVLAAGVVSLVTSLLGRLVLGSASSMLERLGAILLSGVAGLILSAAVVLRKEERRMILGWMVRAHG